MTGPFSLPAPRWFTIPANRPFLDDLAAGLADPLLALGPEVLADAVILAPNRRAARTLSQAFVRATGRKAVLLPQIRALGDLEEGEPPFEPGDLALDLPPAVSPLRRRFELAKLAAGHGRALGRELDAAAALELGDALGGFFDSLEIEEVEKRKGLADLVDAEFAEHWRLSADFLSLAVEAWPRRLAELGLMDITQRQVKLIRRLAEKWAERDPGGVIVAAGSTGSAPATAALLVTIANLRHGAVVLPGLDEALADEAWAGIEADEQHPQSAFRRLLIRAGIDRSAVREWRPIPDAAGRWRRRVINEALRPAEATADWRTQIAKLRKEAGADAPDPIAAGLSGLSTVSAANEEEAAAACAVLLREALETEGKTAALVTPDAALARRVSARLSRWGVSVDSTAGSPLSHCQAGVLISAMARAAVDPADPVTWLSLLKHPVSRPGSDAAAREALEALALRGARPRTTAEVIARLDKHAADAATGLALQIEAAIGAARAPFEAGPAGVDAAARALAEALEKIAAPEDLWAGAGGAAAAGLIAALIEDGAALPPVDPAGFERLIESLLSGETVRLSGGAHPRIQILGVLEGRLIGADRLILAGLEEGVWPPNAPTDPFLSRPMRKGLGLPPPERRIGLSAHDFAQAACAREVVLVSSERRDGQPAVKSRWLWRLETLAKGADLALPSRPEVIDWVRRLDDPGPAQPAPRPAPRPPVAHRPSGLFVTQVETLVRDPYAVWARQILKLRRLDRPDEPVDARMRGTAIHKAFEGLAKLYDEGRIEDAASEFERLYLAELDQAGLPASQMTRERALAREAARWVAELEERRREGLARVLAEQTLSLNLPIDGEVFTVSAKTDRIEFTEDGYVHVLDYKTGSPPTKKMVETGFSPQLTLTAAILAYGENAGLPKATPGELVYLQVTGRRPPGREVIVADRSEGLAAADRALSGLTDLVRRYRDEETPYPSRIAPQFVKTYAGDYDHLARVYEWSTAGAEDGGAE